MTRVSLTECYDDRSVISKLKRIEDKVDTSTQSAEASAQAARQSAQAAQHTADTFSGAVGSVVGEAQREIAKAGVKVVEAKTEVDSVVEDVASAVRTANTASASAQASAQTVQGYEDRLQRAETGIETLDGETADLYARDAMNLKSNEPNQTAQGLRIGTHDLSKAVTTDEAQTITREKTHTANIIIKSDTFNTTSGSNNWTGRFTISDGTHNVGAVQCYSDGKGLSRACLNTTHPVTGASGTLGVDVKSDGSVYAVAPTPTDSAPSNAVVTKANVMSTDGKLNNLVHTIGDETIEGTKTHKVAGKFPSHNLIKHTGLNRSRNPTEEIGVGIASVIDSEGRTMLWLRFDVEPDGRRMLRAFIADHNGNYHSTVLAEFTDVIQ